MSRLRYDAAENLYVTGLVPGDVWTGLHDMNMEGSFEWVTGAPVLYVARQ